MKAFLLNVLKILSAAAVTTAVVFIVRPSLKLQDDNENDLTAASNFNISPKQGHIISDFPHIEQGKKYPTGCETISTLMVLRYYGYDIDADTLIKDYLPCAEIYDETDENGETVIYSYDPNEYFIGDPYDDTSLGCYSPVIAGVIEDYCGDDVSIINRKGTELNKLVKEYVSNDIPVILWATMNMDASWQSISWNIVDTDERFAWISGEHCLVLIGYDKNNYYFSDPSRQEPITPYPRKTVEKRYAELGKQSVVMIPTEKEDDSE